MLKTKRHDIGEYETFSILNNNKNKVSYGYDFFCGLNLKKKYVKLRNVAEKCVCQFGI